MATAPRGAPEVSSAKELLLEDLEHFSESMWRNEEVGEKRLTFFVALVTAVAGGLVTLATATKGGEKLVSEHMFRAVAGTAGMALLLLGLLTYLRMLQRNRVTDEYKKTLAYIRERFVTGCPELQAPRYVVPQRVPKWQAKWLRGGYAETIAAIDGVILSGSLMVLSPIRAFWAAACGLALIVLLWLLAGFREAHGGLQPKD